MNDEELLDYLHSFADSLYNAKTKAEKIEILKANDNPQTIRFIQFMLDNRISTGLHYSRIAREVPKARTRGGFFSMIEYFKINTTGRDEDIAFVQSYINLNEKHRDFLEAVFTKTLPLHVEAKTVNQILGRTIIPEWNVQNAYAIEKYEFKDDEEFWLSQKLNGNRCIVYNGEPISRQGKKFTNIDHILEDLNHVSNQDEVFDGEILRKNVDNISDGENFRIGTGVLNSDCEDKSCLEYVIFDTLPKDEFDAGKSKAKYGERIKRLYELRDKISSLGLKNIRIVPMFYHGTDLNEIDKWLEYAVDNDYEGLMLNRDTIYRCTRNNGILKIKQFYTLDLTVVALQEGTNRYTNMLGAFIVKFNDNYVSVGTGMDEKMRKEVWEHQDWYIGKIIEVKYKEVTWDKSTGLPSLQFPVFVQVRMDKVDESYD